MTTVLHTSIYTIGGNARASRVTKAHWNIQGSGTLRRRIHSASPSSAWILLSAATTRGLADIHGNYVPAIIWIRGTHWPYACDSHTYHSCGNYRNSPEPAGAYVARFGVHNSMDLLDAGALGLVPPTWASHMGMQKPDVYTEARHCRWALSTADLGHIYTS